MPPDHPLDRVVWRALTGRQAPLARGEGPARRLDPEFGPFAAAADASPESLAAMAALVGAGEGAGLVETHAVAPPPGLALVSSAPLHQMIAPQIKARDARLPIVDLTEDDAEAMRALATATEPGPFAARTHRLGEFIGVKVEGRLIAMAGERLKPDGFTEVSAVCTDPAWRGRGYAAALTAQVAARIVARGETPFLHVYPHNAGAIAVYEGLGFTLRRVMMLTVMTRA